ncbi:hypothetical protein [Myroides sp. TSA_177.3]|uniref:hypothetical protein n=1 Tax=Myroides sp. TSA_177.3 TaxID=3415650 RepID=UPI0040466967
MKKRYIGIAGLGLVLALGTQQVHAQQGFGTDKPAKSAAVDIQSSKRGLLIPRVDLVETTNGVTPVNAPAQSLMVYNEKKQNDVVPGYYYWDTNRWVRFAQQGDITAINLAGDVTGPTNATVVGAIQGVAVSNVNPTANQVLTFDATEGKWKAVSLTENNLTSSKGITGTGITVSGETNGANSTLKEVALAITPGAANQVMVTDATGKFTTWVDQSTIAPATTHTIGKVENTNGNTLISTVNGVEATTDIIANVSNTITNNTVLNTTVNGQTGQLDLGPVIQAGQKVSTVVDGVNTTVTSTVDPASANTTVYQVNVSKDAIQGEQKTTSVVGKDNKVSVVTTGAGTTGNNTEYTVGVEQGNLDLAQIGGSLTPGQIAPGTEGQVLTTVEKGGDLATSWETPKEHENIYTHDGTLITSTPNKIQRKVSFGDFKSLFFDRNGDGHDFTFDDSRHTGLNMYGVMSSIGLIASELSNGVESKLKFIHKTDLSEINANSNKGLKIAAGYHKDITLGTFYLNPGEDNETYDPALVIKGDSGVQVVNINKPAFKGAATDKVVVADADGVLKALKAVMPKFFYMPSVMVPTAANQATQEGVTFDNGTHRGTINLYTIYQKQFGTPVMSSPGATALPVLPATELGFHVTYATSGVFTIESIDAQGVMTYTVNASANVNAGSFINIVFSVKE